MAMGKASRPEKTIRVWTDQALTEQWRRLTNQSLCIQIGTDKEVPETIQESRKYELGIISYYLLSSRNTHIKIDSEKTGKGSG
jgi:hypothetical protein